MRFGLFFCSCISRSLEFVPNRGSRGGSGSIISSRGERVFGRSRTFTSTPTSASTSTSKSTSNLHRPAAPAVGLLAHALGALTSQPFLALPHHFVALLCTCLSASQRDRHCHHAQPPHNGLPTSASYCDLLANVACDVASLWTVAMPAWPFAIIRPLHWPGPLSAVNADGHTRIRPTTVGHTPSPSQPATYRHIWQRRATIAQLLLSGQPGWDSWTQGWCWGCSGAVVTPASAAAPTADLVVNSKHTTLHIPEGYDF